ncbi:MAG TPA: nitrate ABC transporter permease [Verrucomicrobiales bacterium]|nr:nitrate ABC transporter permease [Verrucomicrobiales bacterium]
MIARQQATTAATVRAAGIIDAIPRATTSALKRFDAQAAQLAPRLNGWYDEVVAAEEATGTKFKDKVKLKMLAKAFTDSPYPGKDTYIGQIITSLKTVFFGFFIASLVAIPIGILCGLNRHINTALNPLIQIFKPVSPLAWLPIVMIVVGALHVSDDPMFQLSFVNSAITVALCSLWPTLVNTAVGVASVDKDYLNVAKVLKLSWLQRVFKVVLPASLPLVFTGLRLSLGVGWMVLIAAEMLAQNPGLGKFVWDMFQNGSSETLSMIMVAVFTIGIIGFLLDTIMLSLQQLVSFGEAAV